MFCLFTDVLNYKNNLESLYTSKCIKIESYPNVYIGLKDEKIIFFFNQLIEVFY